MKKEKITFDQYYESQFKQRWPELKLALASPSKQIIRATKYAKAPVKTHEMLLEHPVYSQEQYEAVNTLHDGIKHHYIMDLASLICAKALDVKPHDFVLDMCAAPGGKTLVLLEALSDGVLWSNEYSSNRRDKLKNVIHEYVHESDRHKIFIKGKDGNRYGLMHPESFDKILVDAPCSGERHLLNTPRELEKWTPKRTQRLAQSQYSLLCSAILAVKKGGSILYSTCSISDLENDGVIGKALEKKSELIKLKEVNLSLEHCEKTKYGYQFLPDKSHLGPIYFSLLEKIV